MAQNKILLVEDEPDVCSALHAFLGRRGFLVSATPSGRDALAIIPTFSPDLILLDITLVDISGLDVLKTLRAGGNVTKVIIMTGQLMPHEEIDRLLTEGVVAYLQKPVVLSQLEQVLVQVLGASSLAVPASVSPRSVVKGLDRPVVHKVKNLLGVIQTRCENFILNEEEGFHKDLAEHERLAMASGIMKDVLEKVGEMSRAIEGPPEGV